MIKTPEQLKGAIRNMAKEKGIHAQDVADFMSCHQTALMSCL